MSSSAPVLPVSKLSLCEGVSLSISVSAACSQRCSRYLDTWWTANYSTTSQTISGTSSNSGVKASMSGSSRSVYRSAPSILQRPLSTAAPPLYPILDDSYLSYNLPIHSASQDAFDFFTALTDQLDETMKSLGREPVFQHRLQGVFSDQKNCEDCPHRYVYHRGCKYYVYLR